MSQIVSMKIVDAVNKQIGMEFGASLQYDVIAAYFDADSLPQLARFFYKQSTEERQHAHKFMKFIIDVGARVEIPVIPASRSQFEFAKDAVQLSYNQELAVTKSINAIADLATKENDHITHQFLQWFIKEQLEELSSMDQLLKIVERAGESGLLLVEQYLGSYGSAGKSDDDGDDT